MPIDPFQQLQMFNRVVQQISMLRQANTPHGAAPHKPVLLLSLIDYIEEVGLTDNRFPISERLGDIFKRNWSLVVDTKNKCDITLPLFHLQNDHLWRLVSATGTDLKHKLNSLSRYKTEVSYGCLSSDFFQTLMSAEGRDTLRVVLLSRYFPQTQGRYYQQKEIVFDLTAIDAMVLQEPTSNYTPKMSIRLYEGFVREARFQHQVLLNYDYACAITRYKVQGAPLIQACHIEPISMSGNNSIQNGIALSAHLHLAFDYGLIAIDDDYRILVKDANVLGESGDQAYSLQVLKGRNIALPHESRFRPDLDKLRDHRMRWDFQ